MLLHFASKVVTFHANVTFCVSCYILRLNMKSVCEVDINSEVYLNSQPKNKNVLYSNNPYLTDTSNISNGRALIHTKTARKPVAVLLG